MPTTQPIPLPQDLPSALERIRLLETQLKAARESVLSDVLNVLTVEGSDFYYNAPNDYGVITVRLSTGNGDPWERYRGEEIQKQYQNGVRGSGIYGLNQTFLPVLADLVERARIRKESGL